jgi:hypothetical protein
VCVCGWGGGVTLTVWPIHHSGAISAAVQSFYSESRLLSNAKMRSELGVVLAYPTYREGLPAQLRQEQQQARQRHGGAGSDPLSLTAPRTAEAAAAAAPPSSSSSSSSSSAAAPREGLLLLVDNGSVRAAATLSLRALAAQLEAAIQTSFSSVASGGGGGAGELRYAGGGGGTMAGVRWRVRGVSARWSDRVPPAELGGVRAALLLPTLRQLLLDPSSSGGGSSWAVIRVLPLFIGERAVSILESVQPD